MHRGIKMPAANGGKVVAVLTGLLGLALLVSGCTGTGQIIKDITTQAAFDKIQNEASSPDFVLLDVRTPEEFADGHLEHAENIDFYAPDFEAQMDALDKDKTYVIYCRSGSRSGRARDIMRRLGFAEVYNAIGGILQWNQDGLPTVR